jgi:hypothetical protein
MIDFVRTQGRRLADSCQRSRTWHHWHVPHPRIGTSFGKVAPLSYTCIKMAAYLGTLSPATWRRIRFRKTCCSSRKQRRYRHERRARGVRVVVSRPLTSTSLRMCCKLNLLLSRYIVLMATLLPVHTCSPKKHVQKEPLQHKADTTSTLQHGSNNTQILTGFSQHTNPCLAWQAAMS